ncbi:sulfurtransferase [Arthrobacter sp. MYb23]|uniref:sulfurtransferase n=1 Tax=unclassified Arthrobacter TaxID=235627 RepID=UPI000CFB7CA4|nr:MULTISPECIES: sulfurtransferase [unclassified Arthrobacter]PRB44268.1 sulfurtransferase [Arthrobacter sp. MYb51]PRB98520.1 sulfurtransferase [Arthrobacter sp. MYb23]
MATLISASELHARLESGKRTVLLDVRWVLGRTDGHVEYQNAHLPGAVFVDLPTELADHAQPRQGRHPLPSSERFQESARKWGINDGDTVVAYDNSGSMAAARVWWMLRNAGFDSVYLLDGGLAAWRAAGYPVESGEASPAVGNVMLSAGRMPALTEQEAGQWHRNGVLLDARAGERYRGEVEPIDPRAGHIPGAVSAPTTGNVAADGTFLPAEELQRRFEELGLDRSTNVAVYCGSGVTASHEIAALEIAGYQAALYPGSFSQWSNNAANPVALGVDPFDEGADGAGDHAGPSGTSTSAGSSVGA